jgi:hypothetical protein
MDTFNNYDLSQYQDAQPLQPDGSGRLNGQFDHANNDHLQDLVRTPSLLLIAQTSDVSTAST